MVPFSGEFLLLFGLVFLVADEEDRSLVLVVFSSSVSQ